MTEPQPPELDWQWIREAPVHELSAHGREVQARWREAAAGPTPRRPSWIRRLRFRLWLSLARRSRPSER